MAAFGRTHATPKARVEVRDVSPALAARRLGVSEDRFADCAPALYARGFPRPDPTTGLFDLVAIDAWMDRRSGLTGVGPARDASSVVSARLEALRRGGAKA